MRTITIYQDSRFFVSTNCGTDDLYGATRLDLRLRVDHECDVHLAFLEPDALRMLASAIHGLLANYRIAHHEPKSPRRPRHVRSHAPVPLEIWPA